MFSFDVDDKVEVSSRISSFVWAFATCTNNCTRILVSCSADEV